MRCLCIICKDLLDSVQSIVTIPCGHVFHNNCLSQWMVCSKTCPECRHHIEKNISKLYFSFSPDSDIDASVLENKVSTLTAQLYEKDIELKVSEEKRNELQIEIANIEKSRNDMYQILLQLEKDVSLLKSNVDILKTSWQTFKQNKEDLIKKINDSDNMKVKDGSCQKVRDNLNEMQVKVSAKCDEHAVRVIPTCNSLLKLPCKIRCEIKVLNSKNRNFRIGIEAFSF
ncbi:TRAF-interacting protein [Caerostris extrusa]|uniref:TRAF-interacting protein n=1 Tax=Caerostris extrusa TaxID=172846 RepID=A0AAV4Y461_CAEEX|nr:TRAF-interacting protein [Caerostris extrusa]